MKKVALGALLACLCAVGSRAQTFQHVTSYGFRFGTNVTAKSYVWTNDNAYPFSIGSMTFNSAAPVTTLVSVVRPYAISRQYSAGVVETNEMGGVETNYYYVVTNTLISYATNVLISATNTATLFDEDDIPRVRIANGDRIVWDFGVTNSIGILFDAIR